MEQDPIDPNLAELIAKTQTINWDDTIGAYDASLTKAEQLTAGVLVGKVISQRIINKQAMRDLVLHFWKDVEGLEVDGLGNNAFIFKFLHPRTRDSILNGGPSSFRGQRLILKPWNPCLTFGEVELFTTPVCIQIHGLPMMSMSERSITNIANLVGPVLEHEFPATTGIWVSRFFRVKVLLDVRKPLVPGYYQNRREAAPCWVQLKYEKLSEFCYSCGHLGHTQNNCKISFIFVDSNFKFGPRMRTEGPGSEFRRWTIDSPPLSHNSFTRNQSPGMSNHSAGSSVIIPFPHLSTRPPPSTSPEPHRSDAVSPMASRRPDNHTAFPIAPDTLLEHAGSPEKGILP